MSYKANIGYSKKGIYKDATKQSIQIVKDVYRALKEKKKFYDFQCNVNPLRGIKRNSSEIRMPLEFEFCGLTYDTRRIAHGNISKSRLFDNLKLLRTMLIKSGCTPWVSESIRDSETDKISYYDIMTIYAESYLKRHKDGRKMPINYLTFMFRFSSVTSCIFYAANVFVIFHMFKAIALVMVMMHMVVICLAICYFYTYNTEYQRA